MATQNSATKTFHKKTYPSLDPTRPELSAGKTIVVTGGGTGIGAETVKYFAKAGASHVAILGRREQPLLATKAAIEAEYPNTIITAIPTDITQSGQANAAFEKIAEKKKIDVLCSNAAALGAIGNIAELTVDSWLKGVLINLEGNFNVAKAFLEHGAKNGVIIDVNSGIAHMPIAQRVSAYTVSKLAVARFYQCIRLENPELTVFSLQPGVVDTEMARENGYKPQAEGDEVKLGGGAIKGQGAHLFSTRDDVNLPASFMVWLASSEARFLNGKYLWANWDVDELKARAEEIQNTELLSVGLQGWPFE